MTRQRLGDLLVQAGVITDSQLRVALAQQRQHGGKLGEHMVRTNLVSEQQLAIAIAEQLGLVYNDCARVSAGQFSKLLPEHVAVQLQVLPVRFDAGTDTLHVAVADPLDEKLIAQLVRQTGKHIELQVAPKALLRQYIKVAYANIEIHDEGTNEFQLVDIHGRESAVKLRGLDDDLPEASVVDLDPVSDESSQLRPLTAADVAAGSVQAGPHAQGRATPFPTPSARGLTAPSAAAHRPAPQPPSAGALDAGEEALRLVWAMSDLLIERGYFSRAELMAKLRGK